MFFFVPFRALLSPLAVTKSSPTSSPGKEPTPWTDSTLATRLGCSQDWSGLATKWSVVRLGAEMSVRQNIAVKAQNSAINSRIKLQRSGWRERPRIFINPFNTLIHVNALIQYVQNISHTHEEFTEFNLVVFTFSCSSISMVLSRACRIGLTLRPAALPVYLLMLLWHNLLHGPCVRIRAVLSNLAFTYLEGRRNILFKWNLVLNRDMESCISECCAGGSSALSDTEGAAGVQQLNPLIDNG